MVARPDRRGSRCRADAGSDVWEKAPAPEEVRARKGLLVELFGRLLPLVDALSLACRLGVFLGAAAVAWIAVWMVHFAGLSTWLAGVVVVVALIPVLLLLRFWWGLEELRKLPATVGELINDTRGEVEENVARIRAAEPSAPRGLLNAVGSVRQLGSLALEARGLLGAYVNVGTMINPWSILLATVSLFFIPGLVLVAAILGLLVLI